MNKYFFAFALLFIICDSNAQYRRRGEKLIDVSKNKNNGTQAQAGKSNFNTELLLGKWVETKRIDRKSNKVQTFTDSTYINFATAKKMQMKEGNYGKIEADYTITGDQLEISVQDFTIQSLSDSKLILDDKDEWIKEFTKVPFFVFDTYGKNPAPKNEYADVLAPDLKKWQGNWFVFRRESTPGAVKSTDYILKSFSVSEATDSKAAIKLVYYNRDTTIEASGKMSIVEGKVQISTDSFTKELEVYRQNGEEIILGKKNELIYHCKHT